jgi:hypothetical protein
MLSSTRNLSPEFCGIGSKREILPPRTAACLWGLPGAMSVKITARLRTRNPRRYLRRCPRAG